MRTTSLWWGGGPLNMVTYQRLVGSAVAISGARTPPWWWDLIGQMWPAALGEWNWLNANKLCYSFDPPCVRLFPRFSLQQSSSRYTLTWKLWLNINCSRTSIFVTDIITQMYNPSSALFILKSSYYLSTSSPPFLTFVALRCCAGHVLVNISPILR